MAHAGEYFSVDTIGPSKVGVCIRYLGKTQFWNVQSVLIVRISHTFLWVSPSSLWLCIEYLPHRCCSFWQIGRGSKLHFSENWKRVQIALFRRARAQSWLKVGTLRYWQKWAYQLTERDSIEREKARSRMEQHLDQEQLEQVTKTLTYVPCPLTYDQGEGSKL